jgi:hypothetical protein
MLSVSASPIPPSRNNSHRFNHLRALFTDQLQKFPAISFPVMGLRTLAKKIGDGVPCTSQNPSSLSSQPPRPQPPFPQLPIELTPALSCELSTADCQPSSNSFRINTCESVSKQRTLTHLESTLTKNKGGGYRPEGLRGSPLFASTLPSLPASQSCRATMHSSPCHPYGDST